MTDAGVLWTACAEMLQRQVSEPVWLTLFKFAEPIGLDGDELLLALPNAMARERIESRYRSVVEGALADIGAPHIRLRLVVAPRQFDDEGPRDAPARVAAFADGTAIATRLVPTDFGLGSDGGTATSPSDRFGGTESEGVASLSPASAGKGLSGTEERPRYTFDDFVTGTSNRFAQAAAQAVAERPAASYNPLFVYGDAGLGKTHLLHAIAHYVRTHYSRYRVLYVSSETFVNEFVMAIRHNSQPQFKKHYRDVDVLLIDDLQFIEGHERTQEELFHTFEHLHGANKQIVLAADRPPKALATLEDRLRSRFMMGLLVDIQPPDLETRLAILQKKAEREMIDVPHDVLELIASQIKDNIRELEGALNRVTAFANLNGEPPSVDTARHVLAQFFSDKQPRPITPDLILQKTAELFGFPVEELCGQSRRRPLVTARQISMYVFRELTDLSYPMIAKEFGGRDHTTVIHAVEKITKQMGERRQTYEQVNELTEAVKSAR